MNAGLGRRKLVCPNKNASHSEFQQFLETEFPRRKAGGGFELLRAAGGGAGRRKLQVIPPGPEGYNIPYTRGVVGSGVVFVQPLQANLDVSPLQFDVSQKIYVIFSRYHFIGCALKKYHITYILYDASNDDYIVYNLG